MKRETVLKFSLEREPTNIKKLNKSLLLFY